MTTLIFFGTILVLFIYFLKIIWKLLKHRPIGSLLRAMLLIMGAYILIWTVFFTISSDKPIPLGTYVCFDDWCATITKAEQLENDNSIFKANGQFIVLHIKMTNQARGIAQKPSEPRVKIFDSKGNIYLYSKQGQQALEKLRGKQNSIDAKLELHQSLETQLIFDVPAKSKDLKAVIEEGPFITKLLFYSDRKIFLLK